MERMMKTVEFYDSEMEALEKVLDYLWDDESADYEARAQECEEVDHIYSSLVRLCDLLHRMRA
jgi:hypothetical protein